MEDVVTSVCTVIGKTLNKKIKDIEMKKFALSAKEFYELYQYREQYQILVSLINSNKLKDFLKETLNKFKEFKLSENLYLNLEAFKSKTNILEKVLILTNKRIIANTSFSLSIMSNSPKMSFKKAVSFLSPKKVFRIEYKKKLSTCAYLGSNIQHQSKYENEIRYDKHYFLINTNSVVNENSLNLYFIKDSKKGILDVNDLQKSKFDISCLKIDKKIFNWR